MINHTKKVGMDVTKKKVLVQFLVLLLVIGCCAMPAFADETDVSTSIMIDNKTKLPEMHWDVFSYEELIIMRENLNAYIKELERQYAIENGNRIITLNDAAPVIYKGKKFTLEAEVKRVIEEAPETTELLWRSSDETIAKVSAKGVVTAVSDGEAIITCTASDDEYIYAEATVNVVLPVKKLEIDAPEVTLILSERDSDAADITLNCTTVPENAYIQDVTWSSSDEKIATVDEYGNAHAVAPGKVKITAVSKEETNAPKKVTCTVKVQQAVSSIDLNVAEIQLKVRGNQNLTAMIFPKNASNKALVWESSDPDVATVTKNGRVSAVAPGTAIITCTAADGSGASEQCEVTVVQAG